MLAPKPATAYLAMLLFTCSDALNASASPDSQQASVLHAQTLLLYESSFVARQVGSAYPDKIGAKQGMLIVPERRANATSPLIVIGFWVIPTTSLHPHSPVVYLMGGPGHANIDTWRDADQFKSLQALRAVGDVILFDQRGSGSPSESIPSLQCPNPFVFSLDVPWTRIEQVRDGITDGIGRCVAYYVAAGRDLRGYNFDESADDIDDLRKALGYQRLNVWGYSAGSALARHFAERHPRSIERLAFGGVVDTETDRHRYATAFRLMRDGAPAENVAQDAQLESDLESVLNRLDETPVDVETKSGSGVTVHIRLGTYDIVHQLGWATTELSVSEWPQIAAAVHQMAKGDFSWVAPRAALWRLGQHRSLIEGKLSGILQQCEFRSDGDSRPETAHDVFDRLSDFSLSFACKGVISSYIGAPISRKKWHTYTGDTLIYNGDRDVNTPLAGAVVARDAFPRSELLIFDGMSHDIYDPEHPDIDLEIREVVRFFSEPFSSAGLTVHINH